MANLAFPTLSVAPNAVSWGLAGNTQTFVSPLSGAVQTKELPGPRWRCSFTLRDLEEADAALVQEWLARLRGQANRALLYPFARKVPRGTIALSGVTLSGAVSANATSCAFANCGGFATVKRGDFFQIGSELKMVVSSDVTADSSGEASGVAFEPPARGSHSNGASVTTNQPTAVFMLEEPRVAWDTEPGKFSSFSMSFIEQF